MESKILSALGIDPAYLFIFLFMLIILMSIYLVNVNMKYSRLRQSYNAFMRGRDGRNMEETIFEKFDELSEISAICRENNVRLRELNNAFKTTYQKVGIVKYDAFNEMGGKLSFALTLLDGSNSGWIVNAMHSREGCYTYIKEIVRGESYIELSDEEAESLDQAIYQEIYEPDIQETLTKAIGE